MTQEIIKHLPIHLDIPVNVNKQPENQKIVNTILSDFDCNNVPVEMVSCGDVHYVYRVEISPQNNFYIKIRREHFKSNPNISIDPKEIEIEKKSIDILNECMPGVGPDILKYYPEFSTLCLEDVVGKNGTATDLLVNSNSNDYRELGKFVGNLHDSFKNRKDLIRDNFEEIFYKNSLYYRLGFLNIPEVDNLVIDLYKLPKQLIHGDLTPWNIVWDKKNHNFRLYDLETMHRGNPIFDLAFLEAHIILENFLNQKNPKELMKNFRDAYNQSYPIVNENTEVRLAHALVLLRLRGSSTYEPRNKYDHKDLDDYCQKIISEPTSKFLTWGSI